MFGRRDNDTPRSLVTLILELAASVAVGGWMIKLGIDFLAEVWWIIATILLIAVGGIIGYRIWKSKHDNWR